MRKPLLSLSMVCITSLASTVITVAAPAEPTWEKFFPGGLVDSQGEKVSPSVLQGRMVCLYFSASWCGPCKVVTPKLAALRNQAKDFLEVVLVSLDRSEADQRKYMREAGMKWPALKWSNYLTNDGNQVNQLVSRFQAWGIPALVVLSRTGEVVDSDARMKVQFLPEAYVKHLEDYDYDAVLTSFRAEKVKQRATPTKEQEQEYVQQVRSGLEKQIEEFKTLYERTLTPKRTKAPSWEDLLGTFYRSQRKQNAKAK